MTHDRAALPHRRLPARLHGARARRQRAWRYRTGPDTGFYASAGGQPGDRGNNLYRFAGGECPIATTVYDTTDKSRLLFMWAADDCAATGTGTVRCRARLAYCDLPATCVCTAALHLLCSPRAVSSHGRSDRAPRKAASTSTSRAPRPSKDDLEPSLNELVMPIIRMTTLDHGRRARGKAGARAHDVGRAAAGEGRVRLASIRSRQN